MRPDDILKHSDHRPYPMPARQWIMVQSWHNLLFAHWRVPLDLLRAKIPRQLEIDTYDGEAWISVVPFRMSGVRPRFLPAVSWLSDFAELNVRTYVHADGKHGVWFFSLDAAQPLAVELARQWYRLPYFRAKMSCQVLDNHVSYNSIRMDKRGGMGVFQGQYRPTSQIYHSKEGSLEEWLTERYCLYAGDEHRVYRGEINHVRWGLQDVETHIQTNTVAEHFGFTPGTTPELAQYVERLDIIAWNLETIG